ncbi:MAG: transcriptional regulator [Thermoprotei archaeon]|nr:MAG: transcriptional regulator [Thermoprotei archaeon]
MFDEVRREVIREIAVKIAGDIIFSKNPGKAMKKWRERFEISQGQLARRMNISPSMISDYESGRRKSPGVNVLRRFVASLISIDIERGMPILTRLYRLSMDSSLLDKAILDSREFAEPISIGEFCNRIGAELITCQESSKIVLLGYTLVDSIRLVIEVPAYLYIRLFRGTTQRAAIFTNITYGRSSIIAVKVFQAGTGLRPALVVLHGLKKVDRVGRIVAERERIPLAIVPTVPLNELLERLRAI